MPSGVLGKGKSMKRSSMFPRRLRRTWMVIAAVLLGSWQLASAQMSSFDLAHVTTVDVNRFGGGVLDGAWAKLLRTDDAVAMQIATYELEPGSAYTVWWVVFNNPGACSPVPDGDPSIPACGEDDVLNPDGELSPNPLARVSILWAAGGMAGMDGKAAFSAVLEEGNAPGEVLVGSGLEDARKAEVHLVVRTHGQPSMDRLHAQLSSFELTGCDACEDVQDAVFLPN